nr:Tol-Pal system beta propeller repeat protein TolB [Desulfobulbaceae bacterium]
MNSMNALSKALLCIWATLLFCASPAAARIYLDITSADLRKLPIAVPYFIDTNDPAAITEKGKDFATLLGKALTFHGFVSIIPANTYNNDRSTNWPSVGADFAVLANYDTNANGVTMELRFIDAHNNKMLAGKRYKAPWSKINTFVLKFADEVVLKLSGENGISNSQIAFVADQSGQKEIYVADILGENIRQVTRHKNLTVSPRFSADGERLAYTTYHRGNPNLYITDLSQSKKTKAISWHNGLNIAGGWSPNGKQLVTTLSKDGNPDLYLMATNGTVLNRLTHNEGLNVSGSWSPDGSKIVFVSDRSGNPQLYIMNLTNKKVNRLTFYGDENTTPSWSPQGDLIAYTGRDNGNHHLFVIPPEGGSPTKITEFWGNYESPSWSPDGRQLVFSRTRNDKQQLCRIFLYGKEITPMFTLNGNQTYPQWSPRIDYN